MRIVVDTNALISDVFFSGPPCEILHAWRKQPVRLVVSPETLEEYRHVAVELADRFAGVDPTPWLELVVARAEWVEAPPLDQAYARPDPLETDSHLRPALRPRPSVGASPWRRSRSVPARV